MTRPVEECDSDSLNLSLTDDAVDFDLKENVAGFDMPTESSLEGAFKRPSSAPLSWFSVAAEVILCSLVILTR